VLLVLTDTRPLARDDGWLSELGTPLTLFRDRQRLWGSTTYTRLVLYEDHTKVDYTLWPVTLLRRVVERQRLPDLLDWGYRVLLDKDGLTAGLPAPTHTAHIPVRPSERAYRALVEEFWWETIYVAKNLWRDELVHARYNLEVVMKLDLLRRLLEWRIEIDHDWSWKPGIVGRGLKWHLTPDTWAEVEATYAGPGIEENWEALFATTTLFRRVAIEVGEALGYPYPADLDRRVSAYLEEVRRMPGA
jgi:aminoglycoside 6-adenylyltransferase